MTHLNEKQRSALEQLGLSYSDEDDEDEWDYRAEDIHGNETAFNISRPSGLEIASRQREKEIAKRKLIEEKQKKFPDIGSW